MKLCDITRYATALVATLFLGILISPTMGAAQTLDKVSIKLKWFHQFQFAGYYAAKEKGFYAEEGLDVEFLERSPKTDPVDDVVGGQAQYGVSDAGLLLSRLRGKPVVMMAQIFQHSPLIFVTLRESGLRTPTDLVGKRVMTDDLGYSDSSLKAMILKTLGHLNKVEWVTHTYKLEDLAEKRVDAMLAYSTNEPFWYEEQGIKVNIIDPRDYGVDFYGDNLFTTESEIKLNPDRVEKIRRASLKGWKYALAHKDEIIDLILRKYNTQKWTKAHLKFEADQTEKIINPRFVEIGHFEPSRYQKIAGIYTQLSIADRFTVDGKFYYGARIKGAVLTPEEKAWVKSHTVKVGVEQWAPIIFADKTGQARGLAGGFLKKVAESTGLKFEIVADEWDPLLMGLKNRTIDLLPATYFTKERSTYGLYSKPYFYMREFVYVRDGNTEVRSIDDLADKRIAVVKGYGTIPKIRARYPNATIVETKDLLASIDAVLNGNVAALIEAQMAVERTIHTNSIIGLKGINQTVFKASPVHFFSRMDEPLLQSILQKGLNAITEEDKKAEMGKWISSVESERDKLGLSTDELGWLFAHESLRLGVNRAWAPFEFVDKDGGYAGIASGYVKSLSKRLDVAMVPVPGLEWQEVLDKIKVGALDVLPAVERTPETEEFLNFTKPYIKVPMVIVTHKGGPHITEIGDLDGKAVGMVKGLVSNESLRADHPLLKIVEMPDVASLLKALSADRVQAVFGNLWGITYEKNRLEFDDIKIAAPTPYSVELSMGVRKDWPKLVPILEKALSSVNDQEKTAIKNVWMAVEVKFGTDIKTILTWAIPVAAGLALIIAVIVIANRRMSSEITERKLAEQKLQESHNVISSSIAYASRIQRSVLPDGPLVDSLLSDYFILWKPRDVVGGDIYWCRVWGDGFLVMVGDCTGHGVPGAFMTLIATGALDKALTEVPAGQVGKLLQRIHQLIQITLGQNKGGSESDDGMELGACYVGRDMGEMSFAGARFELYLVENGAVSVIKGTKSGIGYRGIPHNQEFQEQKIINLPGKEYYMTSDGLIDQIGGEKGRMFGKKRFQELLLRVKGEPMKVQEKKIYQALLDYQGDQKRRDDVSVIGFHL